MGERYGQTQTLSILWLVPPLRRCDIPYKRNAELTQSRPSNITLRYRTYKDECFRCGEREAYYLCTQRLGAWYEERADWWTAAGVPQLWPDPSRSQCPGSSPVYTFNNETIFRTFLLNNGWCECITQVFTLSPQLCTHWVLILDPWVTESSVHVSFPSFSSQENH